MSFILQRQRICDSFQPDNHPKALEALAVPTSVPASAPAAPHQVPVVAPPAYKG